MTWLALALIGLFAGTIAGLLGIGGGILLTPFFMEAFSSWFPLEAVEQTAIGTSHCVIAMATIMAVMTHRRHREIDFSMVLRILAGALLGVTIGTLSAAKAEGTTIRVMLACVLLAVAYRSATRARHSTAEPPPPAPVWSQPLAGVGIGAFASFFGVGGGVLMVPFLSRFGGKRIHDAMATSSTFIAMNASISALLYVAVGLYQQVSAPLTIGYVHIGGVALGGGGAIVGAKLGVTIARKLPGDRLQRWFSLLLVIVALRMLYRVWWGVILFGLTGK